MDTSDFKSLRAYQLSRAIAAEMYLRVELWSVFHQRTVGAQLVRAADSVGANIAEAMGGGKSRTSAGCSSSPGVR
jgi:four helix bundle protein